MISTIKRIFFASIDPSFEDRSVVNGQEAWEAFQDDFRLKVEAARARHGNVKAVQEERKALVHSALSRSIPTGEAAS